MKLTSALFEAYLKCPTKCYLRSTGQTGSGNAYAEWVRELNDDYRTESVQRLVRVVGDGVAAATVGSENLKIATWRFAVDLPLETEAMESRLHTVERVPSQGRGRPAHFIPVRFTLFNKITKVDRLLVAFDALLLSEVLGREVGVGKIIHGDDHATLKVKVAALAGTVRKTTAKMSALLAGGSPPDLVLNRHCGECEFRDGCHKRAVEKDDLSLLAGMSENERKKYHSKGIFTVTQLSYTFRPRRRPKRFRDKREKYHHPLKALAIREKKIHIIGSPELKIEGTPIFLDVEGLPDCDFYYLIGMRIGNGESAIQHSLWANDSEEEGSIWRQFLAIVETVEKPVFVHYGSYETTFLRRMSERHGGPTEHSVAATGLASAVNILSVIFAQIYFPAFSNGLKDSARFLGFTWTDRDSCGLDSIVWRYRWDEMHDQAAKSRLLTYNAQDCEALSLVTMRIGQLAGCLKVGSPTQTQEWGADAVRADAEDSRQESKWKAFTSPIAGFEQINATAHWNYHRHRVYARSSKALKKARLPHPAKLQPEKAQLIVVWPISRSCPNCKRKARSKTRQKCRIVNDIVFGRNSLKRRVVKHIFRISRCRLCRIEFGIDNRFQLFRQYGWNLVAYLFFQLVELNIPQHTSGRRIIKARRQRSAGSGLKGTAINSLHFSAMMGFLGTTTTPNMLSKRLRGCVT
jgi:predicted RecB family nuclease